MKVAPRGTTSEDTVRITDTARLLLLVLWRRGRSALRRRYRGELRLHERLDAGQPERRATDHDVPLGRRVDYRPREPRRYGGRGRRLGSAAARSAAGSSGGLGGSRPRVHCALVDVLEIRAGSPDRRDR
jgi:hypothetical protein